MTFRRKLLAVFALTVFVSVAAVAGLVLAMTRPAFEKIEEQRTAALVAQFQHAFDQQGQDVTQRIETIARSEVVGHMATALNGSLADAGTYFDLAQSMADEVWISRRRVWDAGGCRQAECVS
jgi:hypothetical protein